MKFNLILISIATCLLSALIHIPNTDIWYSQFVAVMLFGFLLVGINILELNKPLGIFFLYLVFSTIVLNQQSTMSLICLLQTAFCLSMSVYISKFDQEQRRKVWVVIGSLLILQVFWGFLQVINADPFFRSVENTKLCDTVGFSGSHNQYGLFLSAAAPIAFTMPFTTPFVLAAIIFSKTFSALLGFLVSGIFFFRKKLNFVYIGAISLLICCLFFVCTHKSLSEKFTERFGLWNLTVTQLIHGKAVLQLDPNTQRIVTCNPLLGFGFVKFFTLSPLTQKPILLACSRHRYEHAHNDYVEALFDLGIIGFLILTCVFYDLIRLYIQRKEKTLSLELTTAGLIAYAVCALSIYTVHTAYNGFFLCVLLGLFFAEVKEKEYGT